MIVDKLHKEANKKNKSNETIDSNQMNEVKMKSTINQ